MYVNSPHHLRVGRSVMMQCLAAVSKVTLTGVSSRTLRGLMEITGPLVKTTAMSTTCTELRPGMSSSVFSPRPVARQRATRDISMTLSSTDSTTSEDGSRQKFRLTEDTINPYVKNMEYAVRGKMPQEAAKIQEAIRKVNHQGRRSMCVDKYIARKC